MKQTRLLVSLVAFLSVVSRSQAAEQAAKKSVDAGVPQTGSEAKAEVEITGTLKAPIRTKKFVAFVR